MREAPRPPEFSDVRDYGRSLGDAAFWAPYVAAVLAREGMEVRELEAGFAGTFPTFLAGDVVVKLLGYFEHWRECHEAELAVHRLLLDHPRVPAPALLAEGRLYEGGGAPWPYLVTRRLAGTAWREASLDRDQRVALARRLGEVLREVHHLPAPAAPVFQRDWLAEYRAACVERHREWGSLPGHLIDQVGGYLCEPSDERRLIHGDVTEDHVFVQGGRLVGIIDWGDALWADPYYELVALHLGTFAGDKGLLRAFLDAYGWTMPQDFARRAMSAALIHEFNVLARVGTMVPIERTPTLEQAATALWDIGA